MNYSTGGHRGIRTQLLRVMFGGLLVALLSVTVLAHAKLERSEPKSNSTLQQPPQLVELWFSEELESGFNSIEVKDQQGKRFEQGGVTLSEGNKKAQIPLVTLGAGSYTVVWKVLSMDQHTLRGEFTFTVAQGGAPGAATASPPQGLGSPIDPMPTGKRESYEISPSQSAVRWVSYLAMMLLFGGFALYLLVLAPAIRQETLEDPARVAQVRNASARRIVKWALLSIVLLLLTSSISLVFQAAGLFDNSLAGVVITFSAGPGHFQYGLWWTLVFGNTFHSPAHRDPGRPFRQASSARPPKPIRGCGGQGLPVFTTPGLMFRVLVAFG